MLTGPQGVVLLLDFHNYVLPIDDDTLLIWQQQSGEPTPPVVLLVFSLSSLRPLEGDLEYLCERMRHAGAPLLAAVPPRHELAIPTTICCGQQRLDFPAELQSIQELLILCHSSAVEESPPCDRSNLALVVASPRHGTYRLYPQDWFNHARLDYAYQGVTRVARDPESGRIHGDGFRIDPFVLDRTLRNTK